MSHAMEPINLLVVGECGDGKSTLINALRDKAKSTEARSGRHPKGVTKEVTVYCCGELDGVPLHLVDTPGVGDHQITPMVLVSKIEEALTHPALQGGIRGVVVTTPVPGGRIRLGAQIVQKIVDKGIIANHGHDKFANIILVGTKADKAEESERKHFMESLDGEASVRDSFFGSRRGLCVLVSHWDYSPLRAAIRQLPAVRVHYVKPTEEVMTEALAGCLGWSMEDLRFQIEQQRKELDRIQDEYDRNKVQQQKELLQQEETFQAVSEEARVRKCLEHLDLQTSETWIHDATCGCCGQHPLRGMRFHCPICPNYDLCRSCFQLLDHPHEMLQVHQGITCRCCGQSPLLGRRFICTECVEENSHDLCYACYDSGVHDGGHRIIEVHAGIQCDACGQSPILGERFRCTERHDYDLCNTCYRTMDHPYDMYKCSEWTWMYSKLAV